MSANDNAPNPPGDPEPVGDLNVERLLGNAYQPETPRAEFVAEVEARMLVVAEELASERARAAGRRPGTALARKIWRRAAALAVAASLLVGIGFLMGRQAKPPTENVARGDKLGPADTFGKRMGVARLTEERSARAAIPLPYAAPRPEADKSTVLVGDRGLTARVRPPAPPVELAAVGTAIETTEGERRRVTLPDYSVLFLNEGTRVSVEAERQVTLHAGEIFAEVSPRDGSNGAEESQFVVRTTGREITALGTKFAVHTKGDASGVLVTQGKVQVSDFDQPVQAGQQLTLYNVRSLKSDSPVSPLPRASHVLDWTRELVVAAESPLVRSSEHAGGAIVARDPNGQEAKLSLRKYHVDVHIEDGFARTTIDQTYFNHTSWRLEGTFFFPLPPDASLSRLAMYVEGKLMEGGMAERNYARDVFEKIVRTQKDPALLEWIDGSTFKMRVFPLEARQEKRIILSYTQRLESLYGSTKYRFPAGHSLDSVRDWSFHARVKRGAELTWGCDSHELKSTRDGDDLLLDTEAKEVKLDRDVVVRLTDRAFDVPRSPPGAAPIARWSSTEHDGHRYLMLRYRPDLPTRAQRQRRDWVFLFESSGDRDPVLARVQVDVIKTLLQNAEHDDTFAIVTAGTQVRVFANDPLPATPENVKKAVEFLDGVHLVGALDLGQALGAAEPFVKAGNNAYLVHVGSATPVLGERAEDKLLKQVPAGARYVGVGVGKRWSRQFMKSAASRTGGHFTQINPDEPVAWRAFDLYSTLNTPRLLNVSVVDHAERATFLVYNDAIAHGEELCAFARIAGTESLPEKVVVSGTLDGEPFRRVISVENVEPKADYLPRTWAKLRIDQLVAADAAQHKDEIISLSKAMYVMSPFTSLLVLENEQMYVQFNIDRGRKDHWAMYPCPAQIPVVYEPLPPPPAIVSNEPMTARQTASTVWRVLDTILVRVPPESGSIQGVSHYNLGETYVQALVLPDNQDYAFNNGQIQVYFGRSHVTSGDALAWNIPLHSWDTGISRHLARGDTARQWEASASRYYVSWGARALDYDVNFLSNFETDYRSVPLNVNIDKPAERDSLAQLVELEMKDGLDVAQRLFSIGAISKQEHRLARVHAGTDYFRRRIVLPSAAESRIHAKLGGAVTLPLVDRSLNEMPSFFRQLDRQALDQLGAVILRGSPQEVESMKEIVNEMGGFRAGARERWFEGGWANPDPRFSAFHMSDDIISPWGIDQIWGVARMDGLEKRQASAIDYAMCNGAIPLLCGSEQDLSFPVLLSEYFGPNKKRPMKNGTATTFALEEVAGDQHQPGTTRPPLYVRPAFSGDPSVFTDFLAYAPGMNTSLTDVLAVIESETGAAKGIRSGEIDPGARDLIEKARGASWLTITFPSRGNQPPIRLTFDGSGRFTFQRTTSGGLIEQVICDGATLWHLYPELGVGAKRTASRFHRAEYADLVPWWLPPVEELARGANLVAIDEQTVAIVPLGADAAKDDDGKPLPYASVHFVFAPDGRLAERRWIAMPAGTVLVRETYAVDGTVKLIGGDEKVIAERELPVEPAGAPNLVPDTKNLIVLPMPIRSREHVFGSANRPQDGRFTEWSEDAALALVATDVSGNPAEAMQVIGQRFFAKGDRRVGFCTLLLASGTSWDPTTELALDDHTRVRFDPVADHPNSILAKYVFLHQQQISKSGKIDEMDLATGAGGDFVQRLAAFRDLYVRWQRDSADQAPEPVGDSGQKAQRIVDRGQERKRVLEFVRGAKGSLLGWAALTLLQNEAGDVESYRELADACRLFEHTPGLWYAARYENAYCVYQTGDGQRAKELFRDLHAKTLKRGLLPPVDQRFRQAFQDQTTGPAMWAALWRGAAETLIARGDRAMALALALQCHKLGDASMAEELVAAAMRGVSDDQRPHMTLLAIGFLYRMDHFARAEALLRPMLEDEALGRLAALWRIGAVLAEKQGMTARSVACLDHAIDIEYARLPEEVDLESVRAAFGALLGRYEKLADAIASLQTDPPQDVIRRVIRAADRWRSLDPDDAAACQAAARVLRRLGAPDAAWDYATTPMAERPGDAPSWQSLAATLRDSSEFELADRAFHLGFDAEPTNAKLLWDHAQMLEQRGMLDQARQLYNRIADGQWGQEHQSLQEQARKFVAEP